MPRSTEDIEVQLLLEAIYLKYGYDFRNYANASVKRRIQLRLVQSGFDSISELQHSILRNSDLFESLFYDLSINTTEMFRDPHVFLLLRKRVFPMLRTYPLIKIWHAGCSTGEEVYSMAILLKEEGLYDRTTLYATDMNPKVLETAKKGIFPGNRMKQHTQNYQKCGGRESFASYYTAAYGSIAMNAALRDNMVFSDHNLVTDTVFGEMNLIMCRNVLIYFNRELENRVLSLFSNSLVRGGFLCLGLKESILSSCVVDRFEEIEKGKRIFRFKRKV